MGRSSITVREVVLDDAPLLADLWAMVARPGDTTDIESDMRSVISRVSEAVDERVVVAEIDGQGVGAVYLRATTVTPINLEPAVQIVSPHVLADFRRHGVGRALMDAGVSWAEELGIGHVASAASAGSRDANRFMARLSMGPQATLRLATTAAVRAKLASRAVRPSMSAAPRPVNSVLAARRLSRRRTAS